MYERILSRWRLRMLWNGPGHIIFWSTTNGTRPKKKCHKTHYIWFVFCRNSGSDRSSDVDDDVNTRIRRRFRCERLFCPLEAACVKIDDELMTMSSHTRTTNIDRLFSASLLGTRARAFVSSQRINYSVDYQSVMAATTEPQWQWMCYEILSTAIKIDKSSLPRNAKSFFIFSCMRRVRSKFTSKFRLARAVTRVPFQSLSVSHKNHDNAFHLFVFRRRHENNSKYLYSILQLKQNARTNSYICTISRWACSRNV